MKFYDFMISGSHAILIFLRLQTDIDVLYRLQSYLTSQTQHQRTVITKSLKPPKQKHLFANFSQMLS